MDNVEFIIGLILSVYLTRKIFLEHEDAFFYNNIYMALPEAVREFFLGRDVVVFAVATPVLLLLVAFLLRLVTNPLYTYILLPAANAIYAAVNSMNGIARRFISALWRVPKAIFWVLVFGLLLNLFTYYIHVPGVSKWMAESEPYQLLYRNALYPILNSGIAKKIPVIVNDSFRKNFDNIRVIEYFNGVTLEDAVKSSAEIDVEAKKIVGDEENSTKKAQLLYRWIAGNIEYDYDKAEQISRSPKGIASGSLVAFSERKGICFDYSSLYVSMCRAVGLKVRLVTGLGYSGIAWGDHAWNQVYSEEESRWINVDATFGTNANYFDRQDFNVDHKYADIQGEW